MWLNKQSIRVDKMNSSIKSMALEAELDEDKRTLTNHSVRKTLVKKLKASNQLRSVVISVTGHTGERSLADYEEGDEAEQRQISVIILENFEISHIILLPNATTSHAISY